MAELAFEAACVLIGTGEAGQDWLVVPLSAGGWQLIQLGTMNDAGRFDSIEEAKQKALEAAKVLSAAWANTLHTVAGVPLRLVRERLQQMGFVAAPR